MLSKEFNSNWLVRIDYGELHTLIGYNKLVTILDDCASKVFRKLSCSRLDKVVIKPFHGAIFTFYSR